MEPAERDCVRRSDRPVKCKRSYSPEPVWKVSPKPARKGNKVGQNNSESLSESGQHQSQQRTCSQCKIGLTVLQRKQSKRIRILSSAAQGSNVDNNSIESLCRTCALKKDPKKQKALPTEAEKEKYFQEAKSFAASLVDILQDSLAQRLYCPEYKTQPCACLQKFVLAKGLEESKSRATMLLSLLIEAKKLSQLKCYSLEQTGTQQKNHTIGLGNGQKRSLEFEQFVLKKRAYLRGQDIRLCERATQRVLMYSNNFLHKKLKTEPQRGTRVQRKKGKSAMGQLLAMEDLPGQTCCLNSCVLMALSHGALLQQWRQRAAAGQAEARRVLAEMLTPCGGGKFNCFKFIAMVTGVSHSTISKVNEQMKRTGGEREPPEHGLKKWWQEQAKRPRQPDDPKRDEIEKHSRQTEEIEESASVDAEVQDFEETVSGIPFPEQVEKHSSMSIPPTSSSTARFTIKATATTPFINQLGTSFVIPSHVLLAESHKTVGIVNSKNNSLELPLFLPSSCQGTTLAVNTSTALNATLQNSQVLSQIVFDEGSLNTHLLNSTFEKLIVVHQPTKGVVHAKQGTSLANIVGDGAAVTQVCVLDKNPHLRDPNRSSTGLPKIRPRPTENISLDISHICVLPERETKSS